MKILNVIGKIGAVAAAGVGLVLAGKTGFGSDLFSSKGEDDTDDLTEVPVMPEETEEEAPEVVEEATEEEVPE